MRAAVVVHRWFEQGAGWAYAPELKPILLEVIGSLDGPLRAGQEGGFVVKMKDNRCLVGDIASDAGSLDPKARERRPTVLRAVILEREPSPEQTKSIQADLKSLLPARPGADGCLILDVPGLLTKGRPQPAEKADSHSPPRFKLRKALLVMCSAVAVIALTITFAFQQWAGPGPSKSEDLRPAAQEMTRQLRTWGKEVRNEGPSIAIGEYFRFLSQEAVWKTPPTSKHPYTDFIKRLPSHPLQPRKGRWTELEVDAVMRSLVASLEDSPTDRENTSAAADSLKRVDRLMNYDTWRSHSRKPDEELNRFAIAPDLPVLDYVERFRTTSSADFVPVTDMMRVRLSKWRVPLSEKAPVFHVLRSFFTTLQRPDFLSGCSQGDKGHAYWRFADRLPEQAASLGWTCDNRDQLDEALRDLLQALGEPPGGKTTEGLLEAIARQMDYEEWVKQAGRKWNTEGLPESKDLLDFVKRFRPETRAR
jgi:hypothetical protein